MVTTLTLLLAVSAGGQVNGPTVDSYTEPGPPHPNFWGRKLCASPPVDPYAGRNPHRVEKANQRILPPGPGFGWGFPNGAPDGYGYYWVGDRLPLGFTADRTPDYYFNRQMAIVPQQMFFPTYYNSYVMRGQRYIPYTNCGGAHPAGGLPPGSSATPVRPYDQTRNERPVVPVPTFTGDQLDRALPIEPASVDDDPAMRRTP